MAISKFLMKNSPLALVIGQVSFSYAPELNTAGEQLRMPFKDIGLPVAEPRRETNFQIDPLNPHSPPSVQHTTSWLFTNPSKTRGVSIGPKHFAFMLSDYQDFQEFSSWVCNVVSAWEKSYQDVYFNGVGLRYFNVFKPNELPCNWLTESVRGISTNGIETDHFHHRYEFWSVTSGGALHARCTLEHGGAAPPSLQFAIPLFPQKFCYLQSEHIYHLDIFENSRPLNPQQLLSPKAVSDFFSKQHTNIDAVFLNYLSDDGRKQFGWTLKN